jgi:hypothetical protein
LAVQLVPYALQNASHSAALFRQSASAAFATSGTLGSAELAVTQQGTPNMSVVLGAGRAKVLGTSVSPPSGFTWTTQAMYDVLNDAPLTLSIAASNATNPRIDALYGQVQDAFYSGSANSAIAAVATGIPAVSPVTPAIPANSTLIAYIAVAANATTIVSANITQQTSLAQLIGGRPGMVSMLPTSVGGTGTAIGAAGVVTLTNATSADINGCFTALFDNYEVVFDLRLASGAQPLLVLRSSGSPISSGYDMHLHYFSGTGTASATGVETVNGGNHTVAASATTVHSGSIKVFAAMKAIAKQIESHCSSYSGSAAPVVAVADTGLRSTALADGLGLSWGGAIQATGTIRIYGYNNN